MKRRAFYSCDSIAIDVCFKSLRERSQMSVAIPIQDATAGNWVANGRIVSIRFLLTHSDGSNRFEIIVEQS